jgi:hypothetical protein
VELAVHVHLEFDVGRGRVALAAVVLYQLRPYLVFDVSRVQVGERAHLELAVHADLVEKRRRCGVLQVPMARPRRAAGEVEQRRLVRSYGLCSNLDLAAVAEHDRKKAVDRKRLGVGILRPRIFNAVCDELGELFPDGQEEPALMIRLQFAAGPADVLRVVLARVLADDDTADKRIVDAGRQLALRAKRLLHCCTSSGHW